MTLIKQELIPITNTEIQEALALILASYLFVNTTRMARLLNFLINKVITGTTQDTSEYAIGIQVFDRDPATYNPYEDAVVRVQMNRLRSKLTAYYTSLAVAPDIEISIPVGSYQPVIVRKRVVDDGVRQCCLLPAQSLKCSILNEMCRSCKAFA